MAEHALSVGTLALSRREFCAGALCPAAAVVSLVMSLCVWLAAGCLTIEPSREKFTSSLRRTLDAIPALLCQAADVLDGSMLIRRPGPADIDDVVISPLSQQTHALKSAKSTDRLPPRTEFLLIVHTHCTHRLLQSPC